jgi:hypothetical protein
MDATTSPALAVLATSLPGWARSCSPALQAAEAEIADTKSKEAATAEQGRRRFDRITGSPKQDVDGA